MVPMIRTSLRRRRVYPYVTDVFVTLPVLIDTTGNSLDLYDTTARWDDANHLVSRALLSAGVGVAWWDRFGPCTVITLVVRFGATTAALWEIAEYFPFIRNSLDLAPLIPTPRVIWAWVSPGQV